MSLSAGLIRSSGRPAFGAGLSQAEPPTQPPASPPLRASIPYRKQCGVRLRRTDYFVPCRPGYHGARSVNPAEAGCSAALRPHQRDGVTVAVRRDAPGGVGTRNVPQDSPTPPARVEQGTMASKPRASKGACPSAAPLHTCTPTFRRCTTPRTDPRTVAQPQGITPSPPCKSITPTI
jgi:hypothetical protein